MKASVFKIICALCAILILFSACAPSYDEEWVIGKTDDEIIERYGQFDTRYNNYAQDGTYKGWIGLYKIKEERTSYLQTYPEECLEIVFDTNNTAIHCKTVVGRPGN